VLASILTALEARDVFFIDEIHRLNRAVEEALYPPWKISPSIRGGKGRGQTLRLSLKPFTVIGARRGPGPWRPAARPLRGDLRLDYYGPEELTAIIVRSARLLGVEITPAGAILLAGAPAAPGSPTGCSDAPATTAQVRAGGSIDEEVAAAALRILGIASWVSTRWTGG